jgi:hypothetical protein
MKARFKKNLNIIIDSFAYTEFVIMASTGLLMHYTLPAGSGHHTTVWGLDRHEWGALHFWLSVAFLATITLHLIIHWKWIVAIIKGRKTESSGLRFGLGLFGLIALLILALTPLVSPVESIYHPGQQRRLQQTETIQSEATNEPVTIEEEESASRQQISTEQSGSQQSSGEERPGSQQSVRKERTESQQPSETEELTGEHGTGYEYSYDEIAVRGYMTLSDVSEEYEVPVSHILDELGLPGNTDWSETFGRLRRIYDFEMHNVRRIILEYQGTE